LVISHDPTSPQMVAKMRREILEVVSRYVELSRNGWVFWKNSQRATLIANLPIRRIKEVD